MQVRTMPQAELSLVGAIDRVFAVSGAHAMYDGHPLQRVHRDINTASHHAIVDFDNAAEIKGRVELGLEPQAGLA